MIVEHYDDETRTVQVLYGPSHKPPAPHDFAANFVYWQAEVARLENAIKRSGPSKERQNLKNQLDLARRNVNKFRHLSGGKLAKG